DMFTEPIRREAMEHARDTGKSVASGKLTSIHEMTSEKLPGFVVYCPVYEGGTVPDNIPDRAARLQGFVYCVFQVRDLFASVFRDEGLDAGLEIYDGKNTDETNLIFQAGRENTSHLPFGEMYNEVTTLDICGRTWTTRFFAQPEHERAWI